MTTDTDTPAPAAEPVDPTLNWNAKRRAYEETRKANDARGAELTKYREPVRPVVQGRALRFRRNPHTAALRERKRRQWAERW